MDRGGVFAEGAGHGDEDAVDLGLLFVEEADELVVLLDGFEGFDEDGLAGGRGAVDDAGDAALELGFDGDDEAVAADGDEVVLGAAAFAEAAEGFAEALFDGAVLALHGAADAAELGGGVVVEAAVGFDFAAQQAEERGEVVVEQRGGECGDAGPVVACAVGGGSMRLRHAATRSTTVRRSRISMASRAAPSMRALSRRSGGVEEAVEVEAAAAGEHGAHLGGALLLLVDPGEVGAGFECEDPGAAERGGGAAGDVVAEAGPLEGGGAGFAQGEGMIGNSSGIFTSSIVISQGTAGGCA